ncbi:MAG: hypothetical protein M5U34_34125 [Chloroflexi bacterium]|nr:hypothetical protein [Chloroflexota bacterium]
MPISPAYVTVLPLKPVFEKATTPTPVTHVEVTRLGTTAEPSPTPAVCSPLPEGMTLAITPGLDTYGQTTITIELTGLEPGEELRFIYSQEKPDGAFTMEEWDLGAVGENGRFAHTTRLPFSANEPAWQIKVLHAWGVACADITLPNP